MALFVSPEDGAPSWMRPGRARVALYVPARTLPVDSDTHELTFTDDTRPTGEMVDRLTGEAAARVSARVGAVADSLYESAAAVVAVFAAAAVERGWPDDQDTSQALQRARDLEALGERMLAELATANEAVTGEAPNSPGANLLPRWQFPKPVPWGDELFL